MNNIQPRIYLDKSRSFSSHSYIIARVLRFGPGTKILDIGTADGVVGKRIKGKGLILNGIEPVAHWAEIAKPFYNELIIGKIENAPSAFLKNYDVVIFADVLEHLVDPISVLFRVVKHQRSDTSFFISVPNVANIWIRLNLMFGRFEYTDHGLLDKSHLHFFTLDSFKEIIKQVRLEITSIAITPIPLQLLHPFFETTQLGRTLFSLFNSITQLIPRILGYQFIVEARRVSNE